jgi:curved DNA-binding protein CbpA
MSRDLYDILEVPFNANEAWIRRAYEVRKRQLAGDAKLPDDQRKIDLLAVEEALRTLCDPAKRADYDKRILPPAPRNWGSMLVKGIFSLPGVLVIIVAMLGTGYAMHTARQEKQRQEAEAQRIAMEADSARRELARREEEVRQRQEAAEQRRQEIREEQQRKQFERDRRRLDSLPSQAHIEAQDRAARNAMAAQLQQQSEANQRREEMEARARAREEELRRQRFLRERGSR